MGSIQNLDRKNIKEEIADYAKTFLKDQFNREIELIHVVIDHKTLIIRVDDFLCSAEVATGIDKKNAVLIQDMYSRLFDKVKGPFLANVNHILAPEYVTNVQAGINFETRICWLTFILG